MMIQEQRAFGDQSYRAQISCKYFSVAIYAAYFDYSWSNSTQKRRYCFLL